VLANPNEESGDSDSTEIQDTSFKEVPVIQKNNSVVVKQAPIVQVLPEQEAQKQTFVKEPKEVLTKEETFANDVVIEGNSEFWDNG